MDLLDCARLFALTSLAGMDAFIAVFHAKYHYNFWRPLTAVRNADQTGNPATPRDAGWLPLGEDTHASRVLPVRYCITSSAVATVIRAIVGEDIGTLYTDQRHGARRHAPLATRRRLRERGVQRAHLGGLSLPVFWTEVGKDRAWEDRRADSGHAVALLA